MECGAPWPPNLRPQAPNFEASMKPILLLLSVAVMLAACGYYPCQDHAAPTPDPGVCMCECGWQPDADGGACIPKSESCGKLLEP